MKWESTESPPKEKTAGDWLGGEEATKWQNGLLPGGMLIIFSQTSIEGDRVGVIELLLVTYSQSSEFNQQISILKWFVDIFSGFHLNSLPRCD